MRASHSRRRGRVDSAVAKPDAGSAHAVGHRHVARCASNKVPNWPINRAESLGASLYSLTNRIYNVNCPVRCHSKFEGVRMTLLRAVSLAPIFWGVLLSAQNARLDRTVLPISEPKYPHITELDARKAKAPPRHNADRGTPCQQRPSVQQFSYHRALLPDPLCPVDRAQSSHE